MTVNAGAGLMCDPLPFGERLIVEHVRVAAFFPEVFRERISGPYYFQSRVFFES
jgi:hypothetical protein